MNDQVAEMLLEAEDQANAESELRATVLQQIAELRAEIKRLSEAVDAVVALERGGDSTYTITERDEFGRIKSFKVN